MQASPLKKGTKTGFTALPNAVIDQVLGVKHSCDTLALAVYLVRHLAGQAGQITLTGEFTQARMCVDLGWGATNLQRLKRAASQLAAIGMLKTSLRDNNTVVYDIDANFSVARLDAPSAPMTQNHAEEILQASQENFSSPLERKTSDHTRARISKININKLNKQNHLRDVSGESTDGRPKNVRSDDDDWLSVFKLYTQLFKQPVPQSQRARFYAAARESASTVTDITNRLKDLARHPLLVTEVSSINAVWHYAHLKKSAAKFDEKARGLIEDIARTSPDQQSLEAGIKRMVKSSKGGLIDSDLFLDYFASEVAKHAPVRDFQSVRHSDQASSPESYIPEVHPRVADTDSTENLETSDDTESKLPHCQGLTAPEGQELVDQIKTGSDLSHTQTQPKALSVVTESQSNSSPNFQSALNDLNSTSTKSAFITLLRDFIVESQLTDSEQKTLETMLGLALVESTPLQLLLRMVATRLDRRRAA
ncbi:MAG: hypothetical protein FJ146_17155 [Deltaproteobacteria bacterium]|nr:hypothetical protein [Deltaproteobacteria bacterium]